MNFTSKNSVANQIFSTNFSKNPIHNTLGETAMYANMKRMNNEMAVSPIVATLVLIVVAVIGAVAVGTIMGTFSTSVSKNVNAQQASSASQSEILVAGSTTVDPITRAAGAVYSAANPGIKIVSQATGSGAGLQAVGQGVADIGQMSDAVTSARADTVPATPDLPDRHGCNRCHYQRCTPS